jgi:hypothetical protein
LFVCQGRKRSGGVAGVELKRIKPEINEFVDSSPVKGSNTYGIVVMTADGGQSEMAIQRIDVTE